MMCVCFRVSIGSAEYEPHVHLNPMIWTTVTWSTLDQTCSVLLLKKLQSLELINHYLIKHTCTSWSPEHDRQVWLRRRGTEPDLGCVSIPALYADFLCMKYLHSHGTGQHVQYATRADWVNISHNAVVTIQFIQSDWHSQWLLMNWIKKIYINKQYAI